MDLTQQKILKGTITLVILIWFTAFYFKLEAVNAKLDLANEKLDRIQYNIKKD